MNGPIIEVNGIGKCYKLGQFGAGSLREEINRFKYQLLGRSNQTSTKDFWALRDVSFDVAEGEVVGLIGKNGAGKSTMLKLLSRITEPTTGEAIVKGRVASLLEVGTGFHPELSGRDNVFLNGAIMGMTRPEIKAKFDAIVDFAGIERHIDTPVKRYSSGMFVRLGFAIAAHLEPEILIVDEVLAVGDIEFQQKCIGKMKDVSRGGRTVIFVSHNMGVMRSLCSRCVWLHQGQKKLEGASDDVIRAYSGGNTDGWVTQWKESSPPEKPHVYAVSIDQKDHDGSENFRSSEPILLNIELGGMERGNGVVSMEVRDKDGNLIIHSGEDYHRPENSTASKRTATLQKGALAAGTYSIDLYYYAHNGPFWQRLEGILGLNVYYDDCRISHDVWKGATGPNIIEWS
jgi:lipopolysaccharide transport system ATP-binding protein